MKSFHKTRLIKSLALLSLLIVCFAAFYAQRHFGSNTPLIQWGAFEELSGGWQYLSADGREDIDSLPASVRLENIREPASGQLVLYRRLPESLPDNAVLDFVSNQMIVEVYVDNQPIYKYGVESNAPVGRVLGSPWNLVKLPADAAGKELSICFSSPYFRNIYHIPAISLCSKADALHRFFRYNLPTLLFCLVSCIFAILVLIIAGVLRFKKIDVNTASLVFLALFIFLSVIWIMTDSKILLLTSYNYVLIYLLSHMSFMLMPMPLMLFLWQTARSGKRTYGILGILYIVNFITLTGLYFSGIAEFEKTLPITHLLMGIGLIICTRLLIKEQRLYSTKTTTFFLIGLLLLTAVLIISLFSFFRIPSNDNSFYFRLILLLLMLAMLYRAVSEILTMIKKGIEGQVYQKMAYSDSQTQLANRMAFDHHLHALQAEPDCNTLTIVIFDINRLKYVNDTFGHRAGDKLIQSAARCIQNTFGHLGTCYRIGGDEFAVLLKDVPEKTLKSLLTDFQKNTAEMDSGSPEKLSVAAGYATSSTKDGDFLSQLFEQADKLMYRQKGDAHSRYATVSTNKRN